MSSAGGREQRVILCTAARRPYVGDAVQGDVVLDVGSVDEAPEGVAVVRALDLLPAGEAAVLQEACLRFVTVWHAGSPSLEHAGFTAGRAVESKALIDLGLALKHLVLLQRLAGRYGSLRVLADTNQPALLAIRATLLSGEPSVTFEDAVARWVPPIRHVAARVRSALSPRSTEDARETIGKEQARAGATPEGASRPGERKLRLWWLANYRNRTLLDKIQADPRFDVRRFERGEENRYLFSSLSGQPDSTDAPDALETALLTLREADPAIAALAAREFAGIPGAAAVATEVLARCFEALVPSAVSEARRWRQLLREDRPDLITGGIPWGGDLRSLALVALLEGIPFAAWQDGALAEVGAGGVPVGSAALAWGPLGRAWFTRRGFPALGVLEVGDPYLESVRARVQQGPSKELRERLRIPDGDRVLVASVQNSAPHHLESDPADPVRAARILLSTVEQPGAGGWTLVLKLHPRLVLVDGRRRVDLFRRLVRSVAAARIAGPEEDPVKVLALADLHVGEGDTLSLEAVACGKPSILLAREGLPIPYPEFAETGAMPVVRSPAELAERLSAGPPVLDPAAASRLLDLHFRAELSPGDALASLTGSSRRFDPSGRRP